MLAIVHNKLPFPISVAGVSIDAYGTEKVDLPYGFKFNKNRLSVSYIKATETVAEEKPTAIVEPEVVEDKPKPKTKKRKKRSTK